MNNIFNILLVTVATVLSGCATPASQNAMAIGMQDISAKLNTGLKEQVNIRNVTGGKETNEQIMWGEAESAGVSPRT